MDVFDTALKVTGTASVIGGISNSGSGIIQGKNLGISIGTNVSGIFTSFSGGVTNSGTISSPAGTAVGIGVVTVFSGGITNGGLISAAQSGIRDGTSSAGVSTFSGGINNNGTITVGAAGIAVLTNTNFLNGISNKGTISARTGVNVQNVSSFSGGIVNSHTITASGTGIHIANTSDTTGGSTFSGGITNNGVISAGGAGIQAAYISNFAGPISNSGTILGSNGIALSTVNGHGISTFSGGITNTGTISGSNLGISIVGTPAVSVFNSGTITGGSGTAIAFSSGTNTLTLGPGFAINGNVTGAGSDVLQLGGSGKGAFSLGSIGTQYTGFTTFNVVGATWATTGTNTSNWSISSGATLQLGNGAANGLITGNFTDNGTLAFDEPSTTTIASTIGGTGSVTQNGPGTVVLSSTSNAYSGGTTISVGTLQVTNDFSVGTGAVTLSGGTFQAGVMGLVFGNGFVLNSGNDTIDTQASALTLQGSISGAGTLVKIGAGTLTLTTANNYTGGTSLNAGTLAVGNSGALGTNGVTLAGGTVLQAAANGLNLANALTLNGAATIDSQNNSFGLGGTIGGAGSLTKIGSGTLTLTGANNYTGGTSLNAGTLAVGNSSALGTNGVTLAGGTVLQAAATGLNLGNALTLNGAETIDSQNNSFGLGGTIGGGSLTKIGSGTLTLTAANSYTGGTTVDAGTLAVGNSAALGTNGATLAGGTVLQAAANGLSLANALTLNGAATIDSQSNSLSLGGTIGGAGSLTKIGAGTLTLTKANNYTSGTTVDAGTLAIANSGALGSNGVTLAGGTVLQAAANALNLVNALTLNGAATVDSQSNSFGLGGTIGGAGSLTKIGAGTLTLSGANAYSGGTTLSAGGIGVGDSSALGTGALAMSAGTTLSFAGGNYTLGNNITVSGDPNFAPAAGTMQTITGVIGDGPTAGTLNMEGPGTLVLTGANSYTGGTTVSAGSLYIDGDQTAATGPTTIASGATLGGTGTIGGNVSVTAGGTLTPGAANGGVGTLTINGNLGLASGSILDYILGEPVIGSALNDLTVVKGNLTLAGTLNVAVNPAGAFDPGVYRVISYNGALTNNGLALGSVPAGSTDVIQTSVAGEVNLVNTTGVTLNFWDGALPGSKNNNVIDGGTGTWNSGVRANDNWTNTTGALNAPWTNSAFAVFEGTPGTVTVDNSLGQVTASGMQIASSGYLITGGPVTLVETTIGSGVTEIRVGDGTAAGAGMTATIGSMLQGSTQLAKLDLGTLVLTGANTYTGGTAIDGGVLQVASDNNLGAASGGLSFNGGTLATTASFASGRTVTLNASGGTFDVTPSTTLALGGSISGSGSLTKIGAGTLTLTGANTYSGGTSLNAGTLAIGNNAALGSGGVTLAGGTALQAAGTGLSLANALTLNGAATFDSQSDVLSFNGAIGGSGSLTTTGNGFITLNGANNYTGGTSILGGALIGTTSSLQGNILDNAALIFDQTAGGTYAGSLSGNGTLTIHGAGTVTLTGDDSGFTGETRLAQGALAVGTLTAPDATLGGTIDIFSGGLLSGHGTVGTVDNFAGTVMPGGSIGVLTVNGSYTQSSSGTLLIQVTPTASSQLRVAGPAALGGTLELVYAPGTYTPRTYTFLTSPSVSGDFSSVASVDQPPLSENLAITPTAVELLLGGGSSVAPLEVTVFPDMTTVLVQNAQQANSIVLDRLNDRLAGTGMATGGIAAAAPGMQLAQLGNTNLANTEALATALPEALVDRGAWFRGIGSFGTVNGNSTAPGFDTSSGGFLAGFDQPIMPGVIAGLAAGYTHSNVNEHSTASGDVNTARVMAYGGGPVGSGLWSATVGYAHDSISIQRGLPGIGNEQASYDGNELTLGAQWSQPLHFGDVTVVPQAGARFLRLFEGGFAETGASGFNLVGQSSSATSLQPFVGATASRTFVTDSGTQITPTFALGYAREVANDGRSLEVNATDGTTFLVNGVRPSRDILTAGGGVTVKARENLYVYADYDASLPVGNTVNQTFSLGVRIPFPPYSAPTNEPEMQAVPALESTAGADQPALQARQQELFNKMFSAPADLDATLGYAAVSARLGDNEGAAEALERLLLFNPNLPTAQLELGVLYYRMGSFAAAQAYLDKARSLNPSPEVLAQIDEYSAKVAAAQQTNALSGTFSFGTQYQTDANIAPGSSLVSSPIGVVLLSNPYVKHDDTSFFATGSFLYSYGLDTQNGDAIEVTGTGYGNHYLEFNHLDLDFGEATVGPRLRYPDLDAGPLQMATVKPYAILNEVGLGEKQYFWTYGVGLETTAVLWHDLAAQMIYEFRQKDFTNAPDRPLSTGLSGNDNLVRLLLSKPVTLNSQVLGEFDYLDQSTRFAYYANNTYSASLGYHITYEDPMRLLNRPWETFLYGSRTWSIYEGPDPCCNTSGSSTMFSTSSRDDRHWRFGITQSFQLTANTALVAQLQRDIVSSNLPIYGYTSDSFLVDLKVSF